MNTDIIMHRLSKWIVLLSSSMLMLLAGSGCNRDVCNDFDCGEFGNCTEISDEAFCACDSGYEKDEEDRCNIKSTTKFLGNWQVSDTVSIDRDGVAEELVCSYQVTITESDADVRRVTIAGFPDLDCLDTSPISCDLLVEGSATLNDLSIRGLSDGITYCDDQRPDLSFSGFQMAGLESEEAEITITEDQSQMSVSYVLTYTIDINQNGVVETHRFEGQATFVR